MIYSPVSLYNKVTKAMSFCSFHYLSHSACSLHYCMDRYDSDETVVRIDSQACEQLNALLVRLKPSLSYMTLTNFVRSLSTFIGVREFFS